MTDLIYKDETFRIIGSAIEVHKELGFGFLESVYQEAFEFELKNRQIPFESQKQISIYYKDHKLEKFFTPDLICFGEIIVELKAIPKLTGLEESQVINYLKSSKLKLGLLINFGSREKLEWKRLVF